MSNTKATGVAYLDPEFTTCYATEELGYAPEAQGTVTQLTSKSTAVRLNKSMGRITMNNEALAAGTNALFTLNNTTIGSNDVVMVSVAGGGTAGAYWPFVSSQTAGSAVIGVYNNTGGSLGEAIIVNFTIIHGAS
jgi:hypothetical protein